MSLPDFTPQRSLFEPDHQFSELFENNPSADRFRFFANHVLPQIQAMRPQLEEAYCLCNGRPGEEPVRLLSVLLLQFMERLPDRQAVECCQFDLRWKTALGMEASESAFHSTVLVRFRQRLVDHGLEKLAFDACLDAMREAGYLGKKAKRQRLDSTHVIGLVSRMSRLENVRETFRLALEALENVSSLARDPNWTLWWERYVENKPDFRVDKSELKRRFDQAGIDIHNCLKWLDSLKSKAPTLSALNLLRRVFDENYEVNEQGDSDQRRAQPPGAVHNPHDPEAQWSSKDTIRNKEWIGYKAQVAETVSENTCAPGEPTPNVITEISTQEAISSDKAALPEVEEHWEERNMETPDELYVDGGYTSGKELARALEEGRKLQGPMAPAPRKDNRFSADDFDVSVEDRKAVCPGKRTNSQCRRLREEKSGKVTYRFEFSRKHCQACPLKNQCLGKNQKHRTLTVSEHHTLMQARRREQRTEIFKKSMRARNGVEGTISELARGHGLRRSRYRGLAKTRLQNYLIGAACNLRRWSARIYWEEQGATC